VSHFAVSAVGRDRPGIVADVSQAVLEMGGNIEDSKMSILRGHFAVMLVVSAPDELGHNELEAGLEPLQLQLGLDSISVGNLAELHEGEFGAASPTHVVRVYGADRPGIVHAISRRLADAGVSITSLETKLMGEDGTPVYVMLIEAQVPEDVNATELATAIEELGNQAGLEVSLAELAAEGP
jgi:glycine cleavage system transcriptional repressor